MTSLAEHSKEGERAFWYFGNEIIGLPEKFTTRYSEDYSRYAFYIVRIAWNEETERYERAGEWWDYFGNGYYPGYSPVAEGIEGDSETGRAGFLVEAAGHF